MACRWPVHMVLLDVHEALVPPSVLKSSSDNDTSEISLQPTLMALNNTSLKMYFQIQPLSEVLVVTTSKY